jgi:phosphohistidine phosphatase
MSSYLIVRHAIAEERELFARTGRPDGERPLTPKGERRMGAAARGLRQLVPAVGRIVSSPWERARQTARIVQRVYGGAAVEETDLLLPGASPADLLAWLGEEGPTDPGEPTLLVGHEPHLSEWIGWAVTGQPMSIVTLKKGAACRLTFPDARAAGAAVIDWLAPPRLLREAANGGDGK